MRSFFSASPRNKGLQLDDNKISWKSRFGGLNEGDQLRREGEEGEMENTIILNVGADRSMLKEREGRPVHILRKSLSLLVKNHQNPRIVQLLYYINDSKNNLITYYLLLRHYTVSYHWGKEVNIRPFLYLPSTNIYNFSKPHIYISLPVRRSTYICMHLGSCTSPSLFNFVHSFIPPPPPPPSTSTRLW